MRVILFTATGAENLGDELITLCEIRELQKKENINITLFSHSIESTKRFLLSQKYPLENITLREYFPNNIRRNPIRNIRLLWETMCQIKESEIIYIGGGGLFYGRDEEGRSPLFLWSLRVIAGKIFRKKITYLSLGVTAKKEELSPLSSFLFKKTSISVRDAESLEQVKNLGYNGILLPDPVWSLDIEKKNNTEKVIGIALRSGFLSDRILSEIIKKLQEQGYEIILLPHSLHPSDEASHDGYYLQNFLFPGVRTSQSIEQTLEYYKKCHIILGMRFHSMILASIHSIPFIGISYGKKTSSLLAEMNWKYSYNKDMDGSDMLLKAIEDIESNYDELHNQLQKISIEMKEKYIQGFHSLIG